MFISLKKVVTLSGGTEKVLSKIERVLTVTLDSSSELFSVRGGVEGNNVIAFFVLSDNLRERNSSVLGIEYFEVSLNSR